MNRSTTYKEDFSSFPSNWSGHPDATVRDGTLSFKNERYAPADDLCVSVWEHNVTSALLVTNRNDFDDFRMTVKARIVKGSVGLVLRYRGPSEYYMIQFDIGPSEHSDKAWFHCFSKRYESDYGMKRDIVPSVTVPTLGNWFYMAAEMSDHDIGLFFGLERDSMAKCAQWTDIDRTHDSGAVGFWESPGEHAEFRDLEVVPLDSQNTT